MIIYIHQKIIYRVFSILLDILQKSENVIRMVR
nr:MAG TPA: hypothetical protein [Caudoviricetes sp.]